MVKPQPTRVVIAHSHPILRDGLRRLLESKGDFKVIGEASDGTEAVKLVRQLQPDILLIYPRLPKVSGWEAFRELSTQGNTTSVRVILMEAHIEKNAIVEAFQLGVRGIVLLDQLTSDLFKAIRTVMAGEYWVLREPLLNLEHLQTLLQLRHEEERQKVFSLTSQECEIASAVVEGYSNREIAERIKISEDDVKGHLRTIFDKLGVSSRLEIAIMNFRP